jgi:hypothetical protein
MSTFASQEKQELLNTVEGDIARDADKMGSK